MFAVDDGVADLVGKIGVVARLAGIGQVDFRLCLEMGGDHVARSGCPAPSAPMTSFIAQFSWIGRVGDTFP